MPQSIREVMTSNPVTLKGSTSLREAAQVMRDRAIGGVLVGDDGKLLGMVTDRDIVIRGVAAGKQRLEEILSPELVTLTPDNTVEDAIALMRKGSIRRIPVVDGGKPVGMVSIGDLAIERDSNSALASISAAAPNR